jgi:signal transduction histidine kinase
VNHTAWMVINPLAWAVGGALVFWLITLPLHRRSIFGLLASVVLTGAAATVAALIAGVHSMFISANDVVVTITVALVSGLAATAAAGVAAWRLSRDNRALHDAIGELGQGRVPRADGRRLATQLEQVHRDLAHTAERLAASRERESALERSRRELVAWVSHDLRTPLAGLRAMAEALEDGVADAPEQYYKQIRAEVDRLASMVDDLFALSRMQAGSFAIDSESLTLDDLVSDVVAALSPLARRNGVELVGSAGPPLRIVGSASELNRAITNLVANAIRHTPGGGEVEVRVGAASGSAAESMASVSVRDGCGGIPDETLARVFEVGFRGEPARTPRADESGGAGLGLAIVRGIVAAHHGEVEAHNVGDGCEFTISLPVQGKSNGGG